MDECLKRLNPKRVWEFFDEIRKIPRCSGNEKAIMDYLIKFANDNSLEYKKDEIGNILIKKKASFGKKDCKTVILQSHMDMVCEKNSNIKFDFSKDAIQIKREKDWIMAKGTTLGADNGIGVAMSLAILDDENLKHGPLEFLFTVSEETGLIGAKNIDSKMLSGNMMINLDLGNDEEICIGSAGGQDIFLKIPYKKIETIKEKIIEIKITGLFGGHSGEDINKNRKNAIKLLSETLDAISKKTNFDICNINCKNALNAIPREASVQIAINNTDENLILKEISRVKDKIKKEISKEDAKFDLLAECIKNQDETLNIFDENSKKKILLLISNLPNGVLKTDRNMPECVETSVNLASINTNDKDITIGTMARSSKSTSFSSIIKDFQGFAKKNNVVFVEDKSFPSWYEEESELLSIAKESYKSVFYKEPKIITVHAGLECAVIKKKYKKMQIISIGPNMKNLHSPDEMLNIHSVERIYDFLISILEQVC